MMGNSITMYTMLIEDNIYLLLKEKNRRYGLLKNHTHLQFILP